MSTFMTTHNQVHFSLNFISYEVLTRLENQSKQFSLQSTDKLFRRQTPKARLFRYFIFKINNLLICLRVSLEEESHLGQTIQSSGEFQLLWGELKSEFFDMRVPIQRKLKRLNCDDQGKTFYQDTYQESEMQIIIKQEQQKRIQLQKT